MSCSLNIELFFNLVQSAYKGDSLTGTFTVVTGQFGSFKSMFSLMLGLLHGCNKGKDIYIITSEADKGFALNHIEKLLKVLHKPNLKESIKIITVDEFTNSDRWTLENLVELHKWVQDVVPNGSTVILDEFRITGDDVSKVHSDYLKTFNRFPMYCLHKDLTMFTCGLSSEGLLALDTAKGCTDVKSLSIDRIRVSEVCDIAHLVFESKYRDMNLSLCVDNSSYNLGVVCFNLTDKK